MRFASALLACFLGLPCACGNESTSASDASAPGDTGTVDTAEAGVDYGSCGKAIYDCLCKCDGGVSCENACYDPKCLGCINDGVTACCPTEYPAYNKCYDEATKPADGGAAPCASTDTACISARCNKEAAALQTCLATPACKTNRAKCTGGYPGSCAK